MKLTDGGGHKGGIWFSQKELDAHRAAQAIEARRAETLGSVEDESAVAKPCAKGAAIAQTQ